MDCTGDNIVEIKNVLIVGAGNLGRQVAFQCAMHGYRTVLYNVRQAALDSARETHRELAQHFARKGRSASELEAAFARISYTTDLAHAASDADIVNESVPEEPAIKQQVYALLNQHCPAKTIFTTNSSTLLPSQFADVTGRPARFLALHFANQIWERNVAEVMGHAATSPEVFEIVVEFARSIGMVPIRMNREQNGYVMNSMSVPWMTAALALVANDVACPEDVDRIWMISMKTPMGPFGVLDMVGLETAFNISSYWAAAKGDEQLKRNAAYLKSKFLDHNKLGMPSGEGFYEYPNPAYERPDFLS